MPLRRLGAGGFGEVYEVLDRARGRRVALKLLRRHDSAALYQFKQEFRALADIAHVNLVTLIELLGEGDRWCFTMELIDGVDLRAHVRGGRSAGPSEVTLNLDRDTSVRSPQGARDPGGLDDLRLRSALGQLASGVQALHLAGKLHCDIKPSNVLVTGAGLVKVLDFGLVTSLAARAVRANAMAGTPGYVSPEQASGEPLSFASDWYSVGVVLFELLTGTLPIGGSPQQILRRKHVADAPDPRELSRRVPTDLAILCSELLRRDPLARPSGDQVLRHLGVESARPAGISVAGEGTFVGRGPELAVLADALTETRAGRSIVVYLHGSSGMGKTALGRRFLATAQTREGAVVLEGRCYERESVPYKALDPLIDSLAAHLQALPIAQRAALLPRDTALLARLFPALCHWPAEPTAALSGQVDPRELRRRAVDTLREVLRRLSACGPLVLWLDDIHWGDADSASLLIDLLSRADAPALLLLATYRSEEADSSTMVRALREARARRLLGQPREISLGPLPLEHSQELAASIFGAGSGGRAEAAARESCGNPFFIHELARHALAGYGNRDCSLEGMLRHRITQLPETARRLLEAVAVAGGPSPCSAIRDAAKAASEGDLALGQLRAMRLVRTRTSASIDEVEPHHDRIREAVLGGLSSERLSAVSLLVGLALEDAGNAEPETLVVHFRKGGDLPRARVYAVRAAERASEQLAFARAARLYQEALDLALPDQRGALQARLAAALADTGRGADAADAYLAATAEASPDEALRLRRHASEQFLRSGHVDRGLVEARVVLRANSLPCPTTPRRALLSLLTNRARLRLRGLDFVERQEEMLPPADLARIDICWSLANGLGGIDLVAAADFQARHLMLALEAGEPYRVARALAWQAILAAMERGGGSHQRARVLADRAEALAMRIGHSHALAWVEAARAGGAWPSGLFAEAARRSERALVLFREAGRDVRWEVGSVQVWWLLPALIFLGELDQAAKRTSACLKEAEELGDHYSATTLRTYVLPQIWLAADRPSEAARESTDSIERWSRDGWHTQHWCHASAQAQISIYEGQGARAYAQLEACMPRVRRSQLLRIKGAWIMTLQLRARCALAAGGDALRRRAERDAAHLEAEKVGWASAFAALIRAGAAGARGDRATASKLARAAETMFAATDMNLYAAAARRQRGATLGGAEGKVLVDDADCWLASKGVRNPERMVAMLAPGFPVD